MRAATLTVFLLLSGCQPADPGGFELAARSPLDFEKVAMGGRKTLSVLLQNTGSRPIELVTVEGATAVFGVEASGAVSVAPFHPIQLNVVFSPPIEADASVGEREHSGELLFRSEAGVEVRLPVMGRALRVPCTVLGSVDFGQVMVTDTAMQRITVGFPPGLEEPLELRGVTGQAFGGRVEGSSFVLTFRPTALGDSSGEARLFARAQCPDGVAVQLRGIGVNAAVTCQPWPLEFGFVWPGQTKIATLLLRNHGLAPVALSELQARIGTQPSNEYVVGGATSVTLPGASLTGGQWVPGEVAVPVSFSPAFLGLRNGSLVASTTVVPLPMLTCPLRGTGGGPDIEVLPTMLDFGDVTVGVGTTRKVTISNRGTQPQPPDNSANLHLVRWVVTAKNAASRLEDICVGSWDSSAGACSSALPIGYDPMIGIRATAGTSVDIPIRVMPSVAGVDLEWDVVFFSNDPDEPEVTVSVRARGV